jgi:DNA polymerase I-like protein with 3'-5' exonuclease and polymerase domains
MQLVFDIETNGLLPDVNTLHVCCTYDLDTKEEWYSTDPDEIISHLSKATHLIGHNIIDYDLPVLELITGFKPNDKTRITDTLILSRLGNPDRLCHSQQLRDGYKAGPHSLGAWGYRIGVGKPDHEDWSTYSEAMLHRCKEDVRINARIYDILVEETKDYGESIALEHTIQRIISKQERDGVFFDTERAEQAVEELGNRIRIIDERLASRLPAHPRRVGVEVKKPFKKDGTLTKAVLDFGLSNVSGPFTRIEWVSPDLNSDKQVKEWLLSIGWKPTEWNKSPKTGDRTSPKLTEESFNSLPEHIGESLKERVTWRHRRSQIQGWLDAVRPDGCIGAGANPLGTPTGRMRHRRVVNVPKAADFIPFGKEMRALFRARPGRKFVGHDASGLELRMLAHYMNDTEFTEQVLYGDIHSYNQRLAGLPTRDSAKTFIYAFIYGAGDAKLGSIVDGTAADGARLRAQFLSALPKLGELINKVKRAAKRGYLVGLDGRKIWMRRNDNGEVMVHKALNTLLQCAGAVIMKKSLEILTDTAKDLDYIKVIDMHDEGQADVSEKDAELYSTLAVQSIIDAGKHFNLNIPLDGEAKIGHNWAETH